MAEAIYVLLERMAARVGRRWLCYWPMADGGVGAMNHETNDIISLHNITLSYDRHPAVHHMSGGFARGSLTAVIGPNGSGKSTLLRCIAGVLAPESGQLHLSGCTRRDIAYLPQTTSIMDNFPMTVLQLVASGYWRRSGAFGRIDRRMREQAQHALSLAGLEGFGGRALETLSVGQFQRALFARLIVQDTQVILLDEPFNAIDEDTRGALMELVLSWHAQGRTVVCVLHDIQLVQRYFPQALLMARECVSWGQTPLVLTPANMQRARFFSGAWHDNAELCEGV
jgi:zinc/manganese transport system ATP-binding protein